MRQIIQSTKYLFFCIASSLISCNSIPKEKLTVIENLTVGTSIDSLYKQMKSKSVPFDKFTTAYLVIDKSQLIDEKFFITMYYTNLFNTFHDQSKEHVGLLYPVTLSGTDNTVGIKVLLGHTKTPILLGANKDYEYLNTSKCVKLSVNKMLIDQIKEMYSSKYGSPKIDTSKYNTVYTINNSTIEEKRSDEIYAITYTWDTEFIKITFFTGLENYSDGYYKPRDKFYLDIAVTGVAEDITNKMDCYTYSRIEYELKQNAIDELKLKTSTKF